MLLRTYIPRIKLSALQSGQSSLVKNDASDLPARDNGVRHRFGGQVPGRDVSAKHGNSAITLCADSDQCPGLVDGELAGDEPAGPNGLVVSERASFRVDPEADEGIRSVALVAGGDEDEPVVGLGFPRAVRS